MELFLRNDLGMRKGKIASQAGHIFMLLLKDYYFLLGKEQIEIKGNYFKNLMKFFNPYNIKESDILRNNINIVNNEKECLNSINCVDLKTKRLIEDSGLTEFKGQKTITFSGFLNDNELENLNILNNNYFLENFNENYNVKQVLVVNRDKNQNKIDLAPYAAYSFFISLLNKHQDGFYLFDDRIVINLEAGNFLRSYLYGKFPKITLKATTEEINDLKENLKKDNVQTFNELNFEKHHSIGFSPNEKSFFDKYTSHFKLY
tara:strand:+ start:72 stop:851 length:780 start_codon:yes stop_codon:yes gene_type:complete